jgi:hypothetical protein
VYLKKKTQPLTSKTQSYLFINQKTTTIMNNLYITFRQARWLRFLALTIIGLFAAGSAYAATLVDLGKLELGVKYTLSSSLNVGEFTAPASGTLTFYNSCFNAYTSSDYSDDSKVARTTGSYNDDGVQKCTITVTAGTTYYFYTKTNWGSYLLLEMDLPLTLERKSVEDGAALSFGDGGYIDYTFSNAVSVDKATISAGNNSKELSSSEIQLMSNNTIVRVYFASTLQSWYDDGSLNKDDEVVVKLEGVCDASNASSKYNSDGVLEITYKAAGKPLTLVSAGAADGKTTLTNTQYAPNKFLSYYREGNDAGKFVFTFSDALDTEKCTFYLAYGSNEAETYQEEDLKAYVTFSNDNKTVTIDFGGVKHDDVQLSSNINNFSEMLIILRSITGADGQIAYVPGVSGSIGSYNFPFYYAKLKSAATAAFNETLTGGNDTEIYVHPYVDIDFTGIKFAWKENGVEKTVVVEKDNLTIEEDNYNGATITVTVPTEVGNNKNVAVTFEGLSFVDGEDHSDGFYNLYNAADVDNEVAYTCTPNTDKAVGSCDKVEITFTGYEKVAYGAGYATLSYNGMQENPIVLDAATDADENTIAQPIKYATNATTYTVTFPEGYFELGDKAISPEFSVSFTVNPELLLDKSVKTYPADGETVFTCNNKIEVSFPNIQYVGLSNTGIATIVTAEDGEVNLDAAEYGEGNTINQPLGYNAYADGTYKVKFPAGYFNLGNTEDETYPSEAFEVNFTVHALRVESDPANNSAVDACDKLTLTFTEYAKAGGGQTAEKATISFKNRDGESTVHELQTPECGSGWNQMVQQLDGYASEPGNYVVSFPANYFQLSSSDNSSVFSPEFSIAFSIKNPPVDATVVTDPADGSTVFGGVSEIVVTYPNYDEISLSGGKATISKDGGEAVELDDATVDSSAPWNQLVQPLGDNAQQPGTYTVTFPARYFNLGEGDDTSAAFTVTFTVKDFDIETNVAENATVETLDKLHIEFTGASKVTLTDAKATIKTADTEAVELDAASYDYDVYNAIYQPLKTKAAATYTVTFPAGFVKLTYAVESADASTNVKTLSTGSEIVLDSPEFTISFTTSKESGISDITVEGDSDAVYYNLNGVQVVNPSTGVYLLRRGNTVTKKVIK